MKQNVVALAVHDRDPLGLSTDPAGMLTAYLPFPAGTSPQALSLLLRRELAAIGAGLEGSPHAVRERFDASAREMERALDDLAPHAPIGTWMAVTTDAGLLRESWLSRVVPAIVAWGPEARIAPYLAAHAGTTVLVGLVDRHHAQIFSLVGEELTELDRWEVDPRPVSDAPHMSAPAAQGFHRGTGGTPGADIVARRSDHAADVNIARASDRIRAESGRERTVLLGGSREAVSRLRNDLGHDLGERLIVTDELPMHASSAEVRAVANRLVAGWLVARTNEAVGEALHRAASPQVAVGDDAIAIALASGAVSRLLVSEQRLGDRDDRLERMVRLALGQRARVEVAEGDTSQQLLELAGGSVALLRFPSAPPEG